MKRFVFKTLGCKVNQFDSDALRKQIEQDLGWQDLSASSEDQTEVQTDVFVINSCSVTAKAGKETQYLARRFKARNPEGRVVVTGCFAQTHSAKLMADPAVDFVIPNEQKSETPALIDAAMKDQFKTKIPLGVKEVVDNKQQHFKTSAVVFDVPKLDRSRAFIKVQDGCDGFCSYCLIPWARGSSRSVASHEVYTVFENLLRQGAREVVLTGIHIGDYGRDLEEFEGVDYPIAELLRAMVAMMQDLGSFCRVRISSLEPSEVSEALLEVIRSHKKYFCPHFHLPLQSGCDAILKKMRRSYSSVEYADAVQRIREIFPKASIGADVIPGFPGETEEEFLQTFSFIEQLQLSGLHVFPYSLRPNTAAARLPDHLSKEVVSDRSQRLRKLSEKLSREFQQQFIGQTLDLLIESKREDGLWEGTSAEYLKILLPDKTAAQRGQLYPAVVRGWYQPGYMMATLTAEALS